MSVVFRTTLPTFSPPLVSFTKIDATSPSIISVSSGIVTEIALLVACVSASVVLTSRLKNSDADTFTKGTG